ncbi:MAG: dihydrodipicolinate reductase [Nitrospinota bacterium]
MTDRRIRCLSVGLGSIGRALAREALNREGLEWVGAVDVDPSLADRDAGEVLGLDTPLGITVYSDTREALSALRPDVALHTTSSYLPDIQSQVEEIVSAGCSVVSSAEELSFAPLHHRDAAWTLDHLAKEKKAVVLGTGVNPGYVMDRLVVEAARNCTEIAKVRVRRTVDASRRREPLQRKIGAGLAVEAFRERAAKGRFGHAGLQESVALIAHGFGWGQVEVTETLEPVVAGETVETEFVRVEAAQASGIDQRALGVYAGRGLIDLRIRMYVGAETPEDAIDVEGSPDVALRIAGGISGDKATLGRLLSAVNEIRFQPPGLRTVVGLGAFDSPPDPMPIRKM